MTRANLWCVAVLSALRLGAMFRATVLAAPVLCLAALPAHAGEATAKVRAKTSGATASRAVTIPEQGALQNADLIAVAAMALGKTKDPFLEDPTDRYVGRQFHVVLPLEPPSEHWEGEWSYDATAGRLQLQVRNLAGFYQLLYSEKSSGSYVGMNSYGAKVRVDRFAVLAVNLRPASQPAESYDASVAADAAQGRALARNVRMVLDGTLAAHYGGPAAKCDRSPGNPTISNPADLDGIVCELRGHIDRVAFVDIRDGKVLRDWAVTAPKR